jgi:hypothetical protein
MGISPEKNDVDISILFRWGKKVDVASRGGELFSCYVRLVGDAELNRARVFALRKSAELRRLLKNMDSEERMALIADPEASDKEKLIELICYLNTRDITMKAINNNRLDIPFPKELKSNATLEEQEKYQAEIDNWPQKREDKIREYIQGEIDKLKGRLQESSQENIYKMYEETAIAELCEVEMTNKFRQFCVYLGTYKDEDYKEKLFFDFDTFDNLPTEIKQQLLNAYVELEIPMDELKK